MLNIAYGIRAGCLAGHWPHLRHLFSYLLCLQNSHEVQCGMGRDQHDVSGYAPPQSIALTLKKLALNTFSLPSLSQSLALLCPPSYHSFGPIMCAASLIYYVPALHPCPSVSLCFLASISISLCVSVCHSLSLFLSVCLSPPFQILPT
jgi:hypothetical protein